LLYVWNRTEDEKQNGGKRVHVVYPLNMAMDKGRRETNNEGRMLGTQKLY